MKDDPTSSKKPLLSVVCPIFNEEQNVEKLHREILDSLQSLGKPFEVIFVNDGSDDRTEQRCKRLFPLILINFRKNFGQTAALDCGIKKAQGDIILTIDGDLQNDPADFPRLIDKLGEGYDLVSGWRKKRQDPFLKKFISRGADFLRKFLINDNIHDSGCTLKAYRKECFQDTYLFGEMHRFIPAVLKIQGFKVAEIEVNHRARKFGRTKYTWTRVIKGFLDMISVWFWKKYASRPLHLFGGMGIFFFGLGSLLIFILIVLRIFYGIPLSDKIWPMVGIFMVLAGIQLFISGLLADIAVKNYYSGKRKNYVVKNVLENKEEREDY
jgi:glycosyltransferase involved in cell wall biosynthesis